MHPRVRTLNINTNRLSGLGARQEGSPLHWANSADGASAIYLNPDGQVIDAGAPAAGAAADPAVQGVGVTVTSQLNFPSGQISISSAPVVTDVTATSVAESTTPVTNTASAVTSVEQLLPTSSASLSSVSLSSASTSASTDMVDPTTVSTVDSMTSAPVSTSPLDIVPTTLSTPISTSTSSSPTETSQLDSSQDPPERTQVFYLGIAIAVIAFILVVGAIVGWWVRMRRLRREYREDANWPWDHDPFDARQHTLEGGLGIYTDDGSQVKRWDSELVIGTEDDIAPPPPAHTHERTHGSSPFVGGSYDYHPSVADFAQSTGTLHIRNLVPGDISGGESRASTALGVAPTYPEEYGTPYQPQRPAFMSLDGQGLDTPWAPLRTRKSKVAEGRKMRQYARDADMEQVSLEEALPYPRENATLAPTTAEAGDVPDDSWAASIRSNLYNVYSAVVGESTPQAASGGAGDDSFTRQPLRHSQRRRAAPRGPLEDSFDVAHSDTGDSSTHDDSWALEETGMGRGIVHIRDSLDRWDFPPAHNRDSFGDEPNTYAYDSCFLSAGRSSSGDGTSSVYSTTSNEQPPSRVGLHPPRLPSIPNMSATSSQEEYGGGSRRKDSRHSNNRRRTKKYNRPALPTRKSSQESATSVGSEMSRTSSAYSDDLTDGERFAKEILRERHRRMKEMSVGRTKTSRSRATMLSRRRSNLSALSFQ
ncbi:hypothetical protein L227DRAFT_390364 [Lentinus tigrinus ALCF2SS1-6]|uniref:Uncharacterized protein n=1 Tax=Lentinus tigrinus ALCF2SS1-6 TaxID=1328759 RepID=A0A5C2SI02_9APHY|nr:hypothetical protein L227DRAFT_390364 [Lentinus tigrinus ALCF2SS1-6]